MKDSYTSKNIRRSEGIDMSLSILLVDDCDMNRRVISLMLRKLGHQADMAENGAEAVKALEDRYYDLVLMDIEMPVMDGFEATRFIRRRWHQNPKIIAVTALTDSRDACIEAGADDFLVKPLRIEELRDSIEFNFPIPLITEFMPGELECMHQCYG
jgi:CheY-like chemotaxis protein